MELSNKIRTYRLQNDEMTQKRLAELVGVSRQTMNAIENCQHAPKIDMAIRIADVFGVSVGELFEFDYDGKPQHRPIITTAGSSKPTPTTESAAGARVERVERVEQVEHSSMKKGAEREVSMADLRNMF